MKNPVSPNKEPVNADEELENEKSTDTSKKNEPSESSNDSVSSNYLGEVENIDMSEETIT